MHFYPDSAWHIDVCQNRCHLNYDSWMLTVLYGTWLKNGDVTRKPLLRGTTPILRRSVGHGFIVIYVFKMGRRSWAWSTYPFRLQNFFGIILNIRRAASPYLPTDDVTTKEGDLKPPVSCFFGPFKSQIHRDIKISEVFPMCLCVPHLNLCWLTKLQQTIPRRVKLIFLMPGLLSGEWICVQYILSTVQVEYFSVLFDNMFKVIFYLKARSYEQYLAVVPFPSCSHSPDTGRKVKRPSQWCIQIWSLSPARNVSKNESKVPDFGQMKCEMVLYLLRFWPSLWLEMVSSTFTWPGTY